MQDGNANRFRILSLDGGGAKGFYTLGVLQEVEAMLGKPLCEHFDLIYGTSTGAIIAALLATGRTVDEVLALYKMHVPTIMKRFTREGKSEALASLAKTVFKDQKFSDLKTDLGIVTMNWATEQPMIFKSSLAQAHGRTGSFVPGFGVALGDAVQASASAFPFFARKWVKTSKGDNIELADGGFCANNPTLYAIADAVNAYKRNRAYIRVLSLGVGTYPEPKWFFLHYRRLVGNLLTVQLLQKTLETNTKSMEQLREILFNDIQTVRISDTFSKPEMATDLLEHNLLKLNVLRQRGAESFGHHEAQIRTLLL